MPNEVEPITIETIRRLKGPTKGEALRRYYDWVKGQREEYRKSYGLAKIGERRGFSGRYGLAKKKSKENKKKQSLLSKD